MSKLWENIIRRAAFAMDAERAHELGLSFLEKGLASPFYSPNDEFPELRTSVFGLDLPNPVGMAAGFDKNGKVVSQLASLGFGFVEVGTVTARPQPGNPNPRMFRLPEDHALINRLGFNNKGAAALAMRFSKTTETNCIVGVNIGKNKDTPNEDAVENYLECFETIHSVADYIAINISSPNTPHLRELQRPESLDELLSAIQKRNVDLWRKPILVKIAPDLATEDIESAVDVCLSQSVDGMIATNTTVSREGLTAVDVARFGDGGVSGRPLTKRSNEVISTIYRRAGNRLPIIGVGGVFSARDAFDKIAAGASLVQAYTGFVYGGPTFAHDVTKGLVGELAARGFTDVSEAVGSGVS